MAKALAKCILPRLLVKHQIYLPSSFNYMSTFVLNKTLPCCSQILDQGNRHHNQQVPACRNYASYIQRKDIPFKFKFQQMLGMKGGMIVTPKELSVTATHLYMCYLQLVDPMRFIADLEMPDTYNSWYRVTQLHTWMCLVRFCSEGMEGQHLQANFLLKMWNDAKERANKLTDKGSSKEILEMYYEAFLYSIFFYDEGLLGDDKALANSLWNIFFEKEDVDPKHIEFLVGYVRKQIRHLESQSSENIVKHGVITFLPMYSDTLDVNDPILQALQSKIY